jgi:hypothetical protein
MQGTALTQADDHQERDYKGSFRELNEEASECNSSGPR